MTWPFILINLEFYLSLKNNNHFGFWILLFSGNWTFKMISLKTNWTRYLGPCEITISNGVPLLLPSLQAVKLGMSFLKQGFCLLYWLNHSFFSRKALSVNCYSTLIGQCVELGVGFFLQIMCWWCLPLVISRVPAKLRSYVICMSCFRNYNTFSSSWYLAQWTLNTSSYSRILFKV